MNIVIIQNGKPIAVTDGLVDWWKILSKIVPTASFDEYQSKNTIDGMSVRSTIKAFGIEIYKWNQIQNDFVLQDS